MTKGKQESLGTLFRSTGDKAVMFVMLSKGSRSAEIGSEVVWSGRSKRTVRVSKRLGPLGFMGVAIHPIAPGDCGFVQVYGEYMG